MKPKLIDLFCCAGGAGVGYSRAGFDVYGIDNTPQKHYPFPILITDALEAMDRLLKGEGLTFSNGETLYLKNITAFHASPPCQHYSTATRDISLHPDYYSTVRSMLLKIGKPFVIENVINAPYDHGIILCGSMFGLKAEGEWLQRHRNFETSWMMFQPTCKHEKGRATTITGSAFVSEPRTYKHSRQTTFAIAKKLMGINWMTRDEMIEAIPPSYTEYIGKFLMQAVL